MLMKALSGVKASRFTACLLLMGVFAVAGHHFAIVASADGFVSGAVHQDIQSHPAHEHPGPNPVVEAHSPTPIIQKFQLQKQLEIVSSLSNDAFVVDSQYRELAIAAPTDDRLPVRLPLDLKTVFLN